MAIVNGTAIAELLTSGASSDRLNGLGGNDTLAGGGGADTLDGGAGGDSMRGGAGNDFYLVNVAGDKAEETGGSGIDTVQSSITYVLGPGLEKLILTGSGAINGTGNVAANTLTGNLGVNRLNGLGANDTLTGGGGADTLDGGAGADSMRGGAGNDFYIVNAAGDVVSESGGSGMDTVLSSITYTLGTGLEQLILTGGAAISGTGSAAANRLTGNLGANGLNGLGANDTLSGGGGADTLDGGAGADSMLGGTGNDLYIVNAAGDKVSEAGGGGIDTVSSTVTYTLGNGLENLVLTGTAAINGTGNGLANALTGNGFANVIDGGAGVDTLAAGAGDDTLVWDAADVAVDGGDDVDTLRLAGTDALDLAGLAGTVITGIEVIDLGGANALTLTAANLADLSLSSQTLRVDGEGGDAVAATGGWTRIANTVVDTQTYAQYTLDGKTLTVDVDVDRGGVTVSALTLDAVDGILGGRFSGAAADDEAGFALSGVGDINGDGLADFAVGAKSYGAYDAGALWVVFGDADGLPANMAPSSLDGANGFVILGEENFDQLGAAVSGIGDFNGDGIADMVVGATIGGPSNSGAVYVVYGRASGFGAALDLAALDGSNGFELDGETGGDNVGFSVSAAGDVNGDGLADLLVGASQRDVNGLSSGAAYVVFGANSGFGAAVALSALDGVNGFEIDGGAADDRMGAAVSGAGDVNGDGLSDIVVAAYRQDYSAVTNTGSTYVLFGQTGGFGATQGLGVNGTNGFRASGAAADDGAGYAVSLVGDVNGDGYDDVLVGAYNHDSAGTNAGAAYVIYGQGTPFDGGFSLNQLNTENGPDGFRILGASMFDRLGSSVAGVGDVNGDGVDDFAVGALFGDGIDAYDTGAVWVVFGSLSGFGTEFSLSSLDGLNGFRVSGGSNDDRAYIVSGAGDINGDGYDDLLVGARRDDYGASNAGAGYFLFGGDFSQTVDAEGTAGNDSLQGTGADDAMIGGHGADTLDGVGGADALKGAAGDDIITYDGADVAADGGSGTDTLRLAGSALSLDLGSPGAALSGFEIIDLTGTGDNALTLTMRQLLNLSDTSNTLRVDGNAGDSVDGGFGWTRIDDVTLGNGQTYAQYTQGQALLQVDLDVDRSGISTAVSEIDLSTLDGATGAAINGEFSGQGAGSSVSAAGDVNGDGYGDLIVGAPGSGSGSAGYVVYGNATGFGSRLDLSALNGTTGFQIVTEGTSDYLGKAVSGGDVNGDGYADLLVGANGRDTNGTDAGAAYVVFGASGLGSAINLSALSGSTGFEINGEAAADYAGRSVSCAGDVNGDGLADLLIGAFGRDSNGADSGSAYVVFGKTAGFPANLNLSALSGSDGFEIVAEDAADNAGFSVAAAGDLNADGYDDFVVGATVAGATGGKAYVVFGSDSGYGGNLLLTALNGTNGFALVGKSFPDELGRAVSSAGDFNGDGIADLIVGGRRADLGGSETAEGAAYVVFGSATGFASSLSVTALDGANGFRIVGEENDDFAGTSVSGAGDVNGDGYDDLLVGAPAHDAHGSGAGAAYVVFGGADGFSGELRLSALNGLNGIKLSGATAGDYAGTAVAGAGDLNGDGFDDMLVGAYGRDTTYTSSGTVHVVFGRDFAGTIDVKGTGAGEQVTGTGAAETVMGLLGNDTLDGGGGNDVLLGGGGNDVLVYDAADVRRVDGGGGTDTLRIDGASVTLDLTGIGNLRYQGIEKIDLTGSGANTLTLGLSDLLSLSDTSNVLTVDGNAGDAVEMTDGIWSDDGTAGGYHTYTLGMVTLRIDTDIVAVTISAT